jgi:hypothetical protein
VQDIAKLEPKLYTAFLSLKVKLWWSPQVPSVPANKIKGDFCFLNMQSRIENAESYYAWKTCYHDIVANIT